MPPASGGVAISPILLMDIDNQYCKLWRHTLCMTFWSKSSQVYFITTFKMRKRKQRKIIQSP